MEADTTSNPIIGSLRYWCTWSSSHWAVFKKQYSKNGMTIFNHNKSLQVEQTRFRYYHHHRGWLATWCLLVALNFLSIISSTFYSTPSTASIQSVWFGPLLVVSPPHSYSSSSVVNASRVLLTQSSASNKLLIRFLWQIRKTDNLVLIYSCCWSSIFSDIETEYACSSSSAVESWYHHPKGCSTNRIDHILGKFDYQ